jgi:malonyl-CoA O-methyltransferase
MRRLAAELALPEAGASRFRFDQAARSFASASFIHDEARRRLLERMGAIRIHSGTFIDLGSALGSGALALGERFPDARIVAVDSSREMLRRSVAGDYAKLVGDAARLPFPDRSVELIFANMVLPWTRPDRFFSEARRVLTAGGVVMFSTLGPDSLKELRAAWLRDDDAIHVHGFFDVQTLGDLAVGAGLEEPVLDVDRIKVSYSELSAAIRDLRATGSTNTAGGRRRGLTGRGRWHRFVEALWQDQGEGRLSLTMELIFGQAFGATGVSTVGADGEILVPVDRLKPPAGRRTA